MTLLANNYEQDNSEAIDKVNKLLYHFGKAIWQSVPIVGPFINELIFEQFKEQLSAKTLKLTNEEINKIVSLIPHNMNPDHLEKSLENFTKDINRMTSDYLNAVSINLNGIEAETFNTSKMVLRGNQTLKEIQTALTELSFKVPQNSALLQALEIIEEKRQAWIKRISSNQTLFLKHIPDEFISIDKLWPICYTLIPSCGYKEFRFRLHELEWLGLVERNWVNKESIGLWYYHRTESGKQKASEDG